MAAYRHMLPRRIVRGTALFLWALAAGAAASAQDADNQDVSHQHREVCMQAGMADVRVRKFPGARAANAPGWPSIGTIVPRLSKSVNARAEHLCTFKFRK